MAMTKKEKAAFADLRHELRLAKALRWTEPVERDVQPPSGFREIVNGYDFCGVGGYSSPRVDKACTSSSSHSFGNWNSVSTQRPRPMFSTRLRALKAMRHAFENYVATILADIDAQIEDEMKGGAE